MILSAGAFVRVGVLLLVAVVLQLSALSQLTVFGGHADLVVLIVAAVGLLRRQRRRLRRRLQRRPAARPR